MSMKINSEKAYVLSEKQLNFWSQNAKIMAQEIECLTNPDNTSRLNPDTISDGVTHVMTKPYENIDFFEVMFLFGDGRWSKADFTWIYEDDNEPGYWKVGKVGLGIDIFLMRECARYLNEQRTMVNATGAARMSRSWILDRVVTE